MDSGTAAIVSAGIVAVTSIVAGTLVPFVTERARRRAEDQRQNRAAIMTLLPQILEIAAQNAIGTTDRTRQITPTPLEVRLVTQLDLTVNADDSELCDVVKIVTTGARSNLEPAKRSRYVTAAMVVLAEWSQERRKTAGIQKYYLGLLDRIDDQVGP